MGGLFLLERLARNPGPGVRILLSAGVGAGYHCRQSRPPPPSRELPMNLSRREALKAGAALLGGAALPAAAQEASKPLRAGIIGLDTSHVVAFTNLLNNPKNEGDL